MYLARNEAPTTQVHRSIFSGVQVWCSTDFSGPQDWSHILSARTLEEIDETIGGIRRRSITIEKFNPRDFPLRAFASEAALILDRLTHGSGFVVLKGFPVERYTAEEAGIAYLAMGSHLGSVIPQNLKGDRLYSVRDYGYDLRMDYGKPGVRGSKTTAGLAYHTDSTPAFRGYTPDIVGLLAVRTARSGGATRLVNAHTIHNRILERRPELLERLYRPYHFDRRAELAEGEAPTLRAPVFAYGADGLMTRFAPFYVINGHKVAGVPLGEEDLAPFRFVNAMLAEEGLDVAFEMEPGDIQLLNNRFLLHSRTEFADFDDPERRRLLLRLWIDRSAS